MRVLTVRQPFADAIVQGRKTIENRSQVTGVRGLVFIHAAVAVHELAPAEYVERFRAGKITTRAVVGFANLTGSHRADSAECDCSAADGAIAGAAWHWELSGAREFVTPVPTPGALGFWNPSSPSVSHLLTMAVDELGIR